MSSAYAYNYNSRSLRMNMKSLQIPTELTVQLSVACHVIRMLASEGIHAARTTPLLEITESALRITSWLVLKHAAYGASNV